MKNAFKALVVVMAVVMIVLAFGQWSRQSRLGQLYPAAGSFVRVGDLSLHYEEAGRGYPVLLIHGSPGFTRDYKMTLADRTSVFEDLSRDFRVFAVDRPGNGWSDRGGRGGLGLKEQTAAMVGLLDALDAGPAIWVGHSYGGAVVLSAAVTHPDSVSAALVVASTSYSKNFDIEPIFTLGAVAVVGPLMNWTISGLLAPALVGRGLVAAFSPHPVVEGYEEVFKAFVARPGNLRQRAYELATLKEELAAIEGHYGEISIPLTAVYGDRDGLPAVEGAQALGRDVDGARVVALAGLGHEIPHLRPAVVAREVRRLSGAVGAN